jgi:ribosomal-protein-alanine N-acetyltransferase
MIEQRRTDRLILERLREADLGDLERMHSDPRVMETLGGIRSHPETLQFLEQNLDHWNTHGFGLWIFRDRASRQFTGRGGLRHVQVGGSDEVELAYSLLPEYWRRGLATEASKAILDVAFGPLGLAEVVGFTLPTNLKSRRVMEKLGFTLERELIHSKLPHVLFRLDLGSWRGSTSNARDARFPDREHAPDV